MTKLKPVSLEFPPDAFAVLQEAAADPESWAAAMGDPLGFLSERGVKISEGHSITLSEIASSSSDAINTVVEFESDSDSPTHAPMRPAPVPIFNPVNGFGTPIGILDNCPNGSFPILMLEKTTTCIKEGVYKGSVEWVPGPGGGLYGGHWERPVTPICLASATVERWVTVCVTLRPFP